MKRSYPIVGTYTPNNNAGQFIADRANFIGSNFIGQTISPNGLEPDFSSFGYLPSTHIDLMIKDNPSYIIWSYGTPIAWYGTHGWNVPAIKYSPTTSKHQSIVRRAI